MNSATATQAQTAHCNECGRDRGIAEIMGRNYYVLRTCGHVVPIES